MSGEPANFNARAMARWLAKRGRPRTKRQQPGPRPTLGDLQRATPWVWVWCEKCQHHAPLACAVAVIRWGPNTSSDKLRRCARCTASFCLSRWKSSQSRAARRSAGAKSRVSFVRVHQRQLLLGMRRLRSRFTAEANNRGGEARRNLVDEADHGQIMWRNRQRRSRKRQVSHGCLPRTVIASAYSF
jgi:hypothetical protein